VEKTHTFKRYKGDKTAEELKAEAK